MRKHSEFAMQYADKNKRDYRAKRSKKDGYASQPVTAAAIADELEVTVRTVYRDVATLQGSVECDTRWGVVTFKISALG